MRQLLESKLEKFRLIFNLKSAKFKMAWTGGGGHRGKCRNPGRKRIFVSPKRAKKKTKTKQNKTKQN